MRKSGEFIPDETFQMIAIKEGDRDYGYKITELYANSMDYVMGSLFERGVTGLITGENDPQTTDKINRILGAKIFSRPEDYSVSGGGNLPSVSVGDYVSTVIRGTPFDSLRWYKAIRLQGDFDQLIIEDGVKEETGTMAVALAGNLALSGVIPSKKKDGIVVREIKLAAMHPDWKHEKPWIGVEFDLYVHTSCFSVIGFPRDLKTGYIPIDVLERMLKESE